MREAWRRVGRLTPISAARSASDPRWLPSSISRMRLRKRLATRSAVELGFSKGGILPIITLRGRAWLSCTAPFQSVNAVPAVAIANRRSSPLLLKWDVYPGIRACCAAKAQCNLAQPVVEFKIRGPDWTRQGPCCQCRPGPVPARLTRGLSVGHITVIGPLLWLGPANQCLSLIPLK